MEPRDSRSRKTKIRKLREQKFLADSVKGLGDVKKDHSNKLLLIKGLVPPVTTMQR
jgi:hypothetical protein